MARFDEVLIQKLKTETDIVALIESYGTKLKPRGGDELMGLCPAHDDHDPSLCVNRRKNEWVCLGACGTGGDVIKWVMHAEKCSFRHAVDLLLEGKVGALAAGGTKAANTRRLDSPIAPTAEGRQLLLDVANYYHDRLKESPGALDYLAKRGIDNRDAIEHFKIGFSDRTIGLRLPTNRTKDGQDMRSRLEGIGVIKETGHELLRGCITFPIFTADGGVGEIYGRRIDDKSKDKHFYLPGPHEGIFNREALVASDEIILCESMIDAVTFWAAGYRNVTACFGVNGITDELRKALRSHEIKRILIGFDNDEAGNESTDRIGKELLDEGYELFRIRFPHGMDANQYAREAAKSGGGANKLHDWMGLVIRNADWIGKGAAPIITTPTPDFLGNARKRIAEQVAAETAAAESTAQAASKPAVKSTVDASGSVAQSPALAAKDKSELVIAESAAVRAANDNQAQTQATASVTHAEAAKEKNAVVSVEPSSDSKTFSLAAISPGSSVVAHDASSTPLAASPVPSSAQSQLAAEITDAGIMIEIGNRVYRIRGLEKNTAYDVMKLNIMVRRDDSEKFFVDTLDLYAARGRSLFVKEVSRELGFDPEVITRDLGRILLKLESLQEQQIAASEAKDKTKAVEINDVDKAKALELLSSENLLDRILFDFDACGVVGEQNNKLVGYLAATSRKLERPLAIMVQSSSAAGKSSLMEAILRFMPLEAQVNYSAMTGQSLFYMGGMDLQHKILAIAEEEGIKQASYALKLLQSDGQLTIASTGKDPGTGRMETQNYHVEGPVMLFLTTTAIDVDEELLNRCMVLTVDEDPEQTRAIQTQQREHQTLEGLVSSKRRDNVVALHQNAQRLLRPLAVVNHYAHQLQFLTDQTRRRRDHVKYLTLIQAVALLHQYQREVKTLEVDSRVIEYIEVLPRDIQIANQLSNYVLGRSIDELAPQTRRLLLAAFELIRSECQGQQIELVEYRFTRRFLRERLRWGATQLRIHLDRLVEMEYVLVHVSGRGKVTQYELLFDGRGREGELTLCGLIDPNTLVDPHSRSPEREDSKIGTSSTISLTTIAANLAGANDNLAGKTPNVAGSKRCQNGRVTESIGDVLPQENQCETDHESKSTENAQGEDENRQAS